MSFADVDAAALSAEDERVAENMSTRATARVRGGRESDARHALERCRYVASYTGRYSHDPRA